MHQFRNFCAAVMVVAILALPIGVMGCAKEAAPPAAGAANPPADESMDSDLGQPEGGSQL